MASLNLHCGFGAQGDPYDVADAVCRLDADVVCLQESWVPDPRPGADDRDPVADAAAKTGADLRRAAMTRARAVASFRVPAVSGPGEIGIALLTTRPLISYDVLELGCAPGDGIPRVAQVAVVQLASGTPLRVVGTHLTHMLTSPLQVRRLVATLQQLPFAPRMGARDAGTVRDRELSGSDEGAGQALSGAVPTVIMGDLNMPRLLAALTPSFRPTVRGKTYPATRPYLQLDHVLAGPGVRPLAGAVLPPIGSDYLPVRATLQVFS